MGVGDRVDAGGDGRLDFRQALAQAGCKYGAGLTEG
jgi:hypothetical protein